MSAKSKSTTIEIKFTVRGRWTNAKTNEVLNFIKEHFDPCDEIAINAGVEDLIKKADKLLKNKPAKKKEKVVKEEHEKPKEEPKKVEAKPADSEKDNDILERIMTVAADTVSTDRSKIKPETHFENDLSFDSLDMIEFVMKLEDEFDIEIFDSEVEGHHNDTVNDVFKFIKEKLDAKKST